MIELSQREIVDLFIERMVKLGTMKTWTANRADPTEVCEVTASVGMPYGYVDHGDPEYQGPWPENMKVSILSSYYIDIYIRHEDGVEHAMFDPGQNKWINNTPKFFKVFKDVLLDAEEKYQAEEPDDVRLMAGDKNYGE